MAISNGPGVHRDLGAAGERGDGVMNGTAFPDAVMTEGCRTHGCTFDVVASAGEGSIFTHISGDTMDGLFIPTAVLMDSERDLWADTIRPWIEGLHKEPET